MKKYFYFDGTAQQGPFTVEELLSKNISAETPVWYEGLADWTTAGKLDELKDLLVHTPPPLHTADPVPVAEANSPTPVEETPVASTPVTTTNAIEAEKPAVTPVVTETATTPIVVTTTPTAEAEKTAPAATATAAEKTVKTKSSKKSTAWLSYVLGLMVFGGGGYYVYQDMQKNKDNNAAIKTVVAADSAVHTAMQQSAPVTNTVKTDSAKTTTTPATDTAHATTPATNQTATTQTATKTNNPAAITTTPINTKPVTQPTNAKPTAPNNKTQLTDAQKLAQKKIDDAKKKQLALQAAQAASAAAREKDYRNNWSNYINIGDLNYQANNDGISPFDVTVHNGTNAMLDKVVVKVDYVKKDKKTLKSELLTIYNIAPGSSGTATAPEYRRVNNIRPQAYITTVTSKKLHLCFPVNNGNPDDPYFCN